MQSKIRNKLKFLDGEELFRHYISLGRAGSYRQVENYCKSRKIKNPKTGKPPTRMGIWCSMWRWVLRNPDPARKLYASYVLELDGDILDDEEWYSLLESRAHELLTDAGYKTYLRTYPKVADYAE